MGQLSETMCSQSGGYKLIVEVGAPSKAHPALQTCSCEKARQLSTPASTIRLQNSPICRNTEQLSKNKCFARLESGFYRSWVSDEDLGAAIRDLFCWNLEVGHQHLHSFPVGSQKSQEGPTLHERRYIQFSQDCSAVPPLLLP